MRGGVVGPGRNDVLVLTVLAGRWGMILTRGARVFVELVGALGIGVGNEAIDDGTIRYIFPSRLSLENASSTVELVKNGCIEEVCKPLDGPLPDEDGDDEGNFVAQTASSRLIISSTSPTTSTRLIRPVLEMTLTADLCVLSILAITPTRAALAAPSTGAALTWTPRAVVSASWTIPFIPSTRAFGVAFTRRDMPRSIRRHGFGVGDDGGDGLGLESFMGESSVPLPLLLRCMSRTGVRDIG